VSFAAIIHCVASQRVFIVVFNYFVIDSVRKLLDTPSYLTERHALKTYRRVEGQIHAFLTSPLYGGEWLVSRSGRFISGERGPVPTG
jgi:hypothetical protein